MAGAILAARMQKVPVIIDGFVASSAAAVLLAANPSALDHCLFGHVSAEKAHRLALEKMGKTALLDLGMRLGEGTGCRHRQVCRALPFRHGNVWRGGR